MPKTSTLKNRFAGLLSRLPAISIKYDYVRLQTKNKGVLTIEGPEDQVAEVMDFLAQVPDPRDIGRALSAKLMSQPTAQNAAAHAVKAQFNHYYRECPYDGVDIYRVLKMFNVTDPCIQHAVKKLMVAGNRGGKDFDKDISEAMATLTRLQAMRKEEADAAGEKLIQDGYALAA